MNLEYNIILSNIGDVLLAVEVTGRGKEELWGLEKCN